MGRRLLIIAATEVLLGTLILCGAAWWIVGPVIPAHTLESLHGATRDDVRRILGGPSEIQHCGNWIYDRPPTEGWVAISFGKDGRVRTINDEQACPEIFGSGSWEQ
jgi:hypothetical protein